jgi:hypothetical protein
MLPFLPFLSLIESITYVLSTGINSSIPTSSTILTHLFSTAYVAPFQFVPFLYRRLTGFAFSLTFAPVVMGLFVYTRHTADYAHFGDRF